MSSYHIMVSVVVRSRRFWNNSPERVHTNTAMVQQECTKGRWTVSDWKKSKAMQGSWVMSVSKWFADENEDTGLQTAENSKFFGIASSIEPFRNEVKELIIQYQANSSSCQASSSKPKRPMQRTPGSLIRSLKCLSKCCPTFNTTWDQEEDEC